MRALRVSVAGAFLTLLLVALVSSSSCYTQGVTTCGQDSAELAPLRGKLTGDVILTDDAGDPILGTLGDDDFVILDDAGKPIFVTRIDGGDSEGRRRGDFLTVDASAILDDAGTALPVVETTDDGRLRLQFDKEPDGGEPILKRQPQAGSTVAVELCKLYSENPDPSKAHPNYRYATVTRQDGTFELMVPKGTVGLHTFKNGWQYGRIEVPDAPERYIEDPRFVEANARRLNPPVLSNFKATPTEAKPGETLSFSVDTRRAGKDPMSEELIVYEPQTTIARAFAPPARGSPLREVGGAKAGWPDGTWTATVPAPSRPGEYTFYAHSTSEHCVSSNKVSVQIVVR